MSLVLAGPRRIFVLLAFCECVGPARRVTPALPLDLPAHELLGVASSATRVGTIARVRRLHWIVAGWLVGVTLLVIERVSPVRAP
ncbi:MAG: hypothetical protein ACRDH5_10760 [bacterium]